MDPFTKPEHVQGSAEWLAHRMNHIGASEAAACMGICPWTTPYKMWERKLGLGEPVVMNSAMQRGTDMEPTARRSFEKKTGLEVFPQCVYHNEHSFMMSSMDGLSIDRQHAVEIKCPGAKTHGIAVSGKVPEYYMPQLQHQLACLSLSMIYYYSFDGLSGVLLEVPRDDEYIDKMIAAEVALWKCVQDRTPPAMTDKDYQKKDGPKWETLGHHISLADKRIKELKTELKILEVSKESYKQELIEDANGQSCSGGGLLLYRSFPKGRVDYGSIPELDGVDLDKYRKEAKEQWTLRVEKSE